MAQFDQRGQQVHTQYNVGRDMNFSIVQNSIDLVAELVACHSSFERREGKGVSFKKTRGRI